ncbi:MAG: UDP-N-acetylmuramate dehydrogenase [Acidobacteriota bacterium]
MHRLAEIPNLQLRPGVVLAHHTRFGIGGPARTYAETERVEALVEALRAARDSGLDWAVIGAGTNLIVSDQGFAGLVLRFTGDRIERAGDRITVEAGAELQALVDFANAQGLQGLETLAGIPGSVGGAIYGNAGAYGHSISARIRRAWFFDGERIRLLEIEGCEFTYRESVFKRRKDWVIVSAELAMTAAAPEDLRRRSEEILAIRNQKYPPTMKCAGSIFKNLFFDQLPPEAARAVPPEIIRDGKVASGWFLEQAGAKGLHKGDLRVAEHHANLIYNAGAGTARDICALIAELKARVRERFGLELEEEVQYLGF